MTIIPKKSQNERSDHTEANALAKRVGPNGLFARALRQAMGWFVVRPASLTPVLIRSSVSSRINKDYDALGRS